jgi:hypothetical protein
VKMAINYQSPFYETLVGDEDEAAIKSIKTLQATSTTDKLPIAATTLPTSKPSSRCLPEELFRRGVERWLPRPNDPFAYKRILVDAVFPAVSQLLVDYGKIEWSRRPRTFSILYMLGIPEKIEAFIAEGRSDIYLPYNEGNLPDAIMGASLRSNFLKLQNMVRCRREQDILELEEGGKHIDIPRNIDAYFHSNKILGSGRFAKVDSVHSCFTLKTYARKQIHRGQSVLEDRAQLDAFEKELESLKTVSHRHVVKLVGSYTTPSHLGLIMSPIADRDLHHYLTATDVDPEHRRRTLRVFFGCLATALAFIHDKNVRHKDIKPKNVLVKGDQVFLATMLETFG